LISQWNTREERENRVVDALSMMDAWQDTIEDFPSTDSDQACKEAMNNQAISTIQPTWVRELTTSYAEDSELQQLQKVALDPMKY
jgi:hypothetical protein